jgi:hypothetical protein
VDAALPLIVNWIAIAFLPGGLRDGSRGNQKWRLARLLIET